MDKKGRLIVIEGVDGCGKSAQTQLLINRLESKGESYKLIHFPILEKGVYGNLLPNFCEAR